MYSHSNHGHLPDHQHPHHPQSYMNQVMAANSGFFHERELQNIGENKGKNFHAQCGNLTIFPATEILREIYF